MALDDWDSRAWHEERRAEMAAHNTGMTLGEATAWLTGPGFACACTGGPWCCIGRSAHAEAMRRAAHIAVKLMAAADPSWIGES